MSLLTHPSIDTKLSLLRECHAWINGSIFDFPGGQGSLVMISPIDIDLNGGITASIKLTACATLQFESSIFELIGPASSIRRNPDFVLARQKGRISSNPEHIPGTSFIRDITSEFLECYALKTGKEEIKLTFDIYLFRETRLPEYFVVKAPLATIAGIRFEFPNYYFKFNQSRNGYCLCDLGLWKGIELSGGIWKGIEVYERA